jgi:hypothetical protein
LLGLLLAAVLVPASADLVLSVEDPSGLRALLEKAGSYAPSLAPEPVGATLRDRVGVDLFAAGTRWGLAPKGARRLVFSRDGAGLIAPVRSATTAKRMLASWIAGDPQRRAGRVSGLRLLTASGDKPAALLAAMLRPSPLPAALAAKAASPTWLWLRLRDPLRAAVLAIEAGSAGVVARGLLVADGPVLSGGAPAGCAAGIACLRAGVAAPGRRAIEIALAQLAVPAQVELRSASRVEERIDGIDVHLLSDWPSLGRALRVAAVFDAPAAEGPSLAASLALADLDGALARLTPLDALRGPLATGAYALHIVYGALLRQCGPLTLTGNPLGSGAEIELRLPLR